MSVAARLAELGLTLPTPAAPIAAYVPWTKSGKLVFISGQLPLENGQLAAKGQLGGNVTVEAAAAAARVSAINLLAQLNAACEGDLEKVGRCLRLGGFIAATPDFTDHAKVMNGASDLILAVLSDAGRHARTTIGVPSLPLGAAVEVEGLFELK